MAAACRRSRHIGEPTLDTNGYFNQYGQGKKSITIDMGTAQGRALAKRLALGCDLVVSNYATGVMDEWGLGYEALAAERRDVIVGAVSGYGHHGPYKSYMGYGPTTGPLSGLASMTGYPGGDADELGVSLGDPAAGIATAYALVAALVARRRTGEGQFIDTSMWEATTACTAEGWMEWVHAWNSTAADGQPGSAVVAAQPVPLRRRRRLGRHLLCRRDRVGGAGNPHGHRPRRRTFRDSSRSQGQRGRARQAHRRLDPRCAANGMSQSYCRLLACPRSPHSACDRWKRTRT